MSYSTQRDEIEIEGVTFDIERDERQGFPSGTHLYVIDPDNEERIEGLSGLLGYEEHAEFADPRDWCNVSTMVCDYKGYELGDKDAPSLTSLFENTATCARCDGHCYVNYDDLSDAEKGTYATQGIEADDDHEVACPTCEGEGDVTVDAIEYIRNEYGARVILPLYVYEHSGITMRSGAPIGPKLAREDVRSTGRFAMDDAGWDTSTVGFVFDTPKQVKECIGDKATDEQIQKALEQEVQTYAAYLEGDVTYWQVTDEETGFNEGCGGYVGDHEYCEQECFSNLEDALRKRLAENVERNYWLAREVETV